MTTLANLRVKVSRRLEDTANAHWSTAELDDFINEARMDLWQMVRRLNPSILPLNRNIWTWTANTRQASLTASDDTIGGLDATDFDIYLVSMTENTADLGANNLPIPLPRIPYEEVNRGSVSRPPFHEDHKHYGANNYSYAGTGDVSISNSWAAGSSSRIYAWALQGHSLYLSPVPRSDVQLQIEYIKPFVTAGASDQIFDTANAMFRPWESLVELGAVLAAKGRSDEQQDPTMSQWQYKMDLFMKWLEQREITGTPTVLLNGY